MSAGINLREKLKAYKIEFELLQKIPCSTQENEEYRKILENGGVLPEGDFSYYDGGETPTSSFYKIYETDLTESEIAEYLTYKKLSLIKTIKSCVVFFTVLTVIGIIVGFMASLILLGNAL